MKTIKISFTIVICVLLNITLFAKSDPLSINYKGNQHQFRIGVYTPYCIYTPNMYVTKNISQKIGVGLSITNEISLNASHKDFLLVGVEYFMHGINFTSFYFYQDSTRYYTENRKTNNYSVMFHEIDIPILFKHSFHNESNKLHSLFIYGGYIHRFLLLSQISILDNTGKKLVDNTITPTFSNPAFINFMSSFLSIGFGFQKNTQKESKAFFIDVGFRYALSGINLTEQYMPIDLNINNHFINLMIGYKF